ncbi:MAG: hypothetical protein HRT57_03185, partial [Crocinitomicaceae bacterium]|nr:hypothetical protein [Crocinitomicaceae bacterium]
MEKGKKIINYFTVLGFFLILVFPMVNGYMEFIENKEIKENRVMAAEPIFDMAKLDAYTENYDLYYSDNFSLRTNLIDILNGLEFDVLGVSAKPGLVTVGKDGWFYATKSKAFHENAFVFNEKVMRMIRKELTSRNDWCEERGIKYYTAIVPNKMNVYPEYLPRTVFKKGQFGRRDQLVGLNSDPNINMIDIRENIMKHKKDGPLLFQKTDDHWTDYGAFFGYEAIIERVAKDFPELRPQTLEEFTITSVSKEGNMAKMIGLAEEFTEQFVVLKRKTPTTVRTGVKVGYKTDGELSQSEVEMVKVNVNGEPLKCLIIRDSFTLKMMKFLDEHFQSTTYIHDEWRGRLRKDIIEI